MFGISSGSTNLFYLGSALGAGLLLIGVGIGFFMGRRGLRSVKREDGVDRRRLLGLLRDLGAWTHEYRGGVTQYQDQLSELSHRVEDRAQDSPATAEVLPLVEQIMATNRQLQSRLDAAEKQLEDQTQRIESYLTEARTDGLTGLPNRRAFDRKLDELFAAFQRGGRTFVLAMIDIDHFKSFNDTYGHQTGDQVLRHVAQRMEQDIEGAILVARFGGEEFAVLLPSPLKVAASKMDQFRRRCADATFTAEGRELQVTLSIGLSETLGDQVIGTLVRRADEALYAAKGTGRNRTYYHDGKAPGLFGAPEIAPGKEVGH